MSLFTKYRPQSGPMAGVRQPAVKSGLLGAWDERWRQPVGQPFDERMMERRLPERADAQVLRMPPLALDVDPTLADDDDLLPESVINLYREQLDENGLDFLRRGPRSTAERLAFAQRVHPAAYQTAEPLSAQDQQRFKAHGLIDSHAAFVGPDGVVYRRDEDSREDLATRIRRGFETLVGGYDRPGLGELLSRGTTDTSRIGSSPSTQRAGSALRTTGLNAEPGASVRGQVASDAMKLDDYQPTEEELDAIEARFRGYVEHFRSQGWDVAAEALERFLDGTGGVMRLGANWLRGFGEMQDAEQHVHQHFEDWITGDRTPTAHAERIKENLLNLQDGQSFTRSSYWEADFEPIFSPALNGVVGNSNIRGYGDFRFARRRNEILFEGVVKYVLDDRYDWEEGKWTLLPKWQFPPEPVLHDHALLLQAHRGARPFKLHSEWRQRVEGAVAVSFGRSSEDFGTIRAEWSDQV